MMKSDVLFNLAFKRLPQPLASAMVTHGLVSPALLSYYPRKTADELGLTQAQETKLRKVTEGGFAITGVPTGFGSGLIAATGVEVAGTASREVVQNSETGVLPVVPNSVLNVAVAVSSQPDTTSRNSHGTFTLPPASSSFQLH